MVGVMMAMVTSFKRTYARMQQLPGLLYSVPLTTTHAPTGDSWTLTDKSGSVSCGVTAPFSLVQVHTKFCLCPVKISFPGPVKVL